MSVDKSNRILSIDALRGFDMLMIIVADKFFSSLHKGVDNEFTGLLASQFRHADWFGFTFYDIIMPLFLFLVGAVIPFSIAKRLKENNSMKDTYIKLIKRVFILFFLGWIVQGRLLALDINQFHIFSNTLQAIAVGYFFSCLAFIYLTKKGRYIMFAACLIIYALLLTVTNVPGVGKSTILADQNFAIYVDRLVFGRFDDGSRYTWLLSGFGFTATTLSGLFAGELIKSKLPRKKVALYLFVSGVASILIGVIWGIWHPIVKIIWTSSFVLASSGGCLLLLALFYWVIDVKGWVKWSFPLKVIGMNAIAAYVLSHVFAFPEIAKFVLFGLEKYTGQLYTTITVLGGFGILYLLLWYMYKKNTFIKV